MIRLVRWLAQLPLSWLHSVGAVLGRFAYALSPSYRRRLRDNFFQAGFRDEALLRESVVDHGKGALEMPALWLAPVDEVVGRVTRVSGVEVVEAAERTGKGIIYLTPHLGSFEVAAQWLAKRAPLTVLYRPPRKRILEPLMLAGRTKANMRTATTDLAGVRVLLRALRKGEAIGMLPDQVPSKGEGEWAEFFGRPAYTMTLAARLAESTGAPLVIGFAERLPRGEGFVLHIEPMPEPRPDESAARWMNRAMEAVIRRRPTQYLWAYNRFKVPSGVAPPPKAVQSA